MWEKIKSINALSLTLHGDISSADEFTFQSMRDHVDEIHQLMDVSNVHWKAETVDLIIHGYLMLERHGVRPEEIKSLMVRRQERFREKIESAIRENR